MYSDIVTFLTKCKNAEVVHRVFLGDYVKIYDASDPNLYMVTGVTWFPLTAKKRRAEPPTPVLFSPSRPLCFAHNANFRLQELEEDPDGA